MLPRVEHNKLVIMVCPAMAQDVFSFKNKSLQKYALKLLSSLFQTILEDIEQTVE